MPSVWLSLWGEGRWGPLPSPNEGLMGQARSSHSAMSVGTPLREVPLTGLTSTPRPQVPPSRVFRPLGSRVLSHRPQTSRSITETPFPAQYSLVDICALPVEPGLSPSPLSRGPAPLSSAPCTCLGPGKNPKEQVRGHGGQRTGRGHGGQRTGRGSRGSEDRLGVMGIRGQVGGSQGSEDKLGVTGSGQVGDHRGQRTSRTHLPSA